MLDRMVASGLGFLVAGGIAGYRISLLAPHRRGGRCAAHCGARNSPAASLKGTQKAPAEAVWVYTNLDL